MALGHFCLIHFGFPLSVSSTISPCRLRLRVALTRRIGGRNSDHWVGEKSTFNFCSSLKEYIACTSNNKQCLASVLLDLTDWEIIVRWTTNPHPLLAVQVSTFTGSFLQVQVKFGGEKKLDELAGCETTWYQSFVRYCLDIWLRKPTKFFSQDTYCVLRPRFEPDNYPIRIVRFTGWANVPGFSDEISNNLSQRELSRNTDGGISKWEVSENKKRRMQQTNLLLARKTDCRTLGTDRWNEQPRGNTVQPVFRNRSAA